MGILVCTACCLLIPTRMVSLSVSGSLLPSADSAPRRALVRQALRLSQSMAPKKDGRKEALKERHRLAAEAKARGQIIVNDAAIDAVNEATAGPSWVLAMDAEHSTREEDILGSRKAVRAHTLCILARRVAQDDPACTQPVTR